MFFVLKNVIRLVVSLVCLSPIILPLIAIERTPLVTEADQQTLEGVSAGEILRRFDPRNFDPSQTTPISVRDSEISGALGAALSRVGAAHGRVLTEDGSVVIQGTAQLPIPDTFLGRYLNVQAKIAPSQTALDVTSLSMGSLSVPGWIIRPVAVYLLDWFIGKGKGEPIYASVKSVEVSGDMITVGIQPPEGLIEDVHAATVKAMQLDNAEAIRSYYLTIAQVSTAQTKTPVSLAEYLGPLFSVAQERSQSGDPVAENRALILALAMHFGDTRFQALLKDVDTSDIINTGFKAANVKLENRHDWVQHFTTTAALQVAAGSKVSNLIGEVKEIHDGEGPSGFSFTDIAADRTGVRFAEVATASEESARAIQSALASGAREGDFFPRVGDLPEGLSEAAFKSRYGTIESPAFESVVQQIDGRIGKIGIYN